MPRKKLLYTHKYPYHVVARANNREDFPLPKTVMWELFRSALFKVNKRYGLELHGFVLMSNHYHMVVSTHKDNNLGRVMCHFQTLISRAVNLRSGRINHVFGGNYRGSLITTPEYFATVLRYLFRNPVEAGLCRSVEDYRFSSYADSDLPLSCPITGIQSLVPWTGFLEWVNRGFDGEERREVQKGLEKAMFRPVRGRRY